MSRSAEFFDPTGSYSIANKRERDDLLLSRHISPRALRTASTDHCMSNQPDTAISIFID